MVVGSEARVYSRDMIDLSKCSVLERKPGKVSGNWLFKGTRLPLHVVIENLKGGATLDEISDWFEVDRGAVEQALQFLADATNEPLLAEAEANAT